MGVAVVDAVTCAYTRTGPDEQLPPAQFTVVPSEHLHTFAAVAVRPWTSGAAFSAAFCMPRVFDALPALELPYWAPARAASATEMAVRMTSV
jgi:hypothetical protein